MCSGAAYFGTAAALFVLIALRFVSALCRLRALPYRLPSALTLEWRALLAKSTYRVKSCTVRLSHRALLAQDHFSYGMRGKRACDPSWLGTHGNGAEPAPMFITASMSLPRGHCAHSAAKRNIARVRCVLEEMVTVRIELRDIKWRAVCVCGWGRASTRRGGMTHMIARQVFSSSNIYDL